MAQWQRVGVGVRHVGSAGSYSHSVSGAHFDWSEVLAAGGSLSLFADKQIVEVRVPSGKPGKEGSTAIQQLAASARRVDRLHHRRGQTQRSGQLGRPFPGRPDELDGGLQTAGPGAEPGDAGRKYKLTAIVSAYRSP